MDDLFRGQLRVFDSSVLPTQKSKTPQFLLFFICSLSANYAQQFLGYLVQKTIDTNSSPFIKTTAISYIASFIARGKFISQSLVHSTLKTLCGWAISYAQMNSSNNNHLEDQEKHLLFYHLCQAIFYMFCFRFEHILDRTTRDECLSTFNIIEIIQCSLNPFLYCNPIVVRELIEISSHLNIAKLVKISNTIESRNRSILTLGKPIEASFPFDPYLLKNSSQWIQDIYCSWEDRGATEDLSTNSYSDDYHDLSSSVPDDFDVIMSFTPDAAYDISMHFPRSPIY